MAFILSDRVRETTTTTGTGNVTLAGAVSGFQTFDAAMANNDTTYYVIALESAGEWEVGIGTFVAATPALARTTVLASSNAGSAVNFSAGTKQVFMSVPAMALNPRQYAIIEDQKAQNTQGGTSVATTWTTRDLNTEVSDAYGLVTISSNQFTPVRGLYRVVIDSPFVSDANNQVRIRLYNITQSSEIARSINVSMTTNSGVQVQLETIFEANGTDAYAVQYYLNNAFASGGLGTAVNEASAVERYTRVFLEKTG